MSRKTSLKSRILNYINSRDYWINGKTIEELAMNAGYKGSNASRRCRKLAEEPNPSIDRKIEGRAKSVWYKKLTKTF